VRDCRVDAAYRAQNPNRPTSGPSSRKESEAELSSLRLIPEEIFLSRGCWRRCEAGSTNSVQRRLRWVDSTMAISPLWADPRRGASGRGGCERQWNH
jgi:hypothetical protein